MNRIKKFMALFLAVVLIAQTGVAASAEESTSPVEPVVQNETLTEDAGPQEETDAADLTGQQPENSEDTTSEGTSETEQGEEESDKEDGEQPEITVVCGSMQRARAMEDCLSQRVSSASIHCSENHHEVEQAHEAGLSVGRYRLLLELQKQDPNITADDIAGLSMAQIRAMLEATDTEAASPGHHQGHAHHGQDE